MYFFPRISHKVKQGPPFAASFQESKVTSLFRRSQNKSEVTSSEVERPVTNFEETAVQRTPIEETAVSSFSSCAPEKTSDKSPGEVTQEHVDPQGKVKWSMEVDMGKTMEKDAIDELVDICRA